MNSVELTSLIRHFHRQMLCQRLSRWAAAAGLVMGLWGVLAAAHRQVELAAWVLLFLTVSGWLMLVLRSVRLTREIQAGGILLSMGRLDDAETWLRRGMTRFSLSQQAKLVAGELLAMLLWRRGAHQQVVTLCRELLRYPLQRVRDVWVNTRLVLTESLLALGRVDEAHATVMPLVEARLSLDHRMKLLPVQLRCELTAGQAERSVRDLADKMRLAELMDAPRAALVHALLAEACRRQGMAREQDFLTERAGLYHDLKTLVEQFPLIAPVAAVGDQAPH